MEVAIVYALLAYPSGRLTTRAERAAVGAGIAIVLLLYMPATFMIGSFPVPTPWTGCTADCPANAFQIFSSTGLDGLGAPVREAAASALFIAVGVILAVRVHRTSPLARTALVPVLAVAICRFVLEGSFLFLRGQDVSVDAVEAVSIAVALTIPLIALGFLLGLLRWRMRTSRALALIGGSLEAVTTVASLQALLREALRDPSLEVSVRRSDGEWEDAGGAPRTAPLSAIGQRALEVEGEGPTLAVVVCDAAVCAQESLVRAVRACVRSALDHERLTRELKASLREVAASRARIAAAADAERRRIERDLHDGAQQRLIALGIRLGLVEDEIERDPAAAHRMLADMRLQTAEAIEEMRALSRGIYPPLLRDAGPAEALRSAALNMTVPVVVRSRNLRRHQQEVESTVFFCSLEAMQNAIKHGGTVHSILVEIDDQDRRLAFTVTDDGRGFDAGNGNGNGSGITNMRDRLAAVGGSLKISFPTAGGTVVRGSIPVAAPTPTARPAFDGPGLTGRTA
jgi:signal transduction histidine kinase